jgi:hypothetical protein
MAVAMVSTISYDMTPYSLVETHWRFGGTYCPNPQGRKVNKATSKNLLSLLFSFDSGGGTFLRNVCKLLPDYPASITETLLYIYKWVSCKEKMSKDEGRYCEIINVSICSNTSYNMKTTWVCVVVTFLGLWVVNRDLKCTYCWGLVVEI